MKIYYPYFNLFNKKGTSDYTLEMLIKMPEKCYNETIEQNYDGERWIVKINLKDDLNLIESTKEKLEEFSIKLTPNNISELDKIRILVIKKSNLLEEGDTVGQGDTDKEDSETEP